MKLDNTLIKFDAEYSKDNYIPLSENATKIVETRYLLPEEKNWSDVCQRVARCVSSGLILRNLELESIKEFELCLYNALINRDFIFNSPTLFNIGKGVPTELLYGISRDNMTLDNYKEVLNSMNDKNMLSACFVVPVENSIDGIYTALRQSALISKGGGGVGYSFSNLSHKGRPLDSGTGVASGPLSFMQVFDASAKAVVQGGRRRAAQMGILRVDHPDIIDFISAKSHNDDNLSFFNISVMITDEFMKAVKEGTGFQLKDPVTHQPVTMIDARGLWNNIIYYAWKSGDPGLLFFESANRDRYIEGEWIEASNPCITGDTLVAVADGRGSVPIKQLAEEGKDVPVYTVNDKGQLVIRMMRNPRCTGKNKPIYRVTLDSGNYLDVTDNHKLYLQDGTKKEAKDLQYGDKLYVIESNYKELAETAEMVNCKVVSVEFIGYQDVYNGTVDDCHNFFIGGFECKTNRAQRPKVKYVRVANCGEIISYSYSSCTLAHINLSHLINNKEIDYGKFLYLIKLGTEALDLIIDINHYPIPEIAERTKSYRPIGLGIMGFAHMLFKLGIRYGSQESLKLASNLSKLLTFNSIIESINLAKQFGAYPAFQNGDKSILETNSVLNRFISEYDNAKSLIKEYGVRNASWTMCAPTGTCSLICDTSSGIEPVFALEHERIYIDNDGTKKKLKVQDPIYAEYLSSGGDINVDYFVDAHSVLPEEHVRMQAAWQEYISSGISKTINLPHTATEEDVKKVYELAYELGCKGITIFRDGCKEEQVLYRKDSKQKDKIIPVPRPETTYGITKEFDIACGTLYITLNFDADGNPIETFLTSGKGGVCRANIEALSRMVSISLRSGIAKEEIVKQLKGIRCPYCLSKKKKYLSCADALATFLASTKPVYSIEVEDKIATDLKEAFGEKEESKQYCPECGAEIRFAEGCVTCLNCGYSKCS